MLTLDDISVILDRILKMLRRRYGESYVEGIKVRRSRYEIYMSIGGAPGKVVININNLKIRVYTGLKGQEIAIKRMFSREIERYLRMKK